MSSRKIIIPKGLVDHPEQNSVIEVSSRLNQSKGNLIAKRHGQKLVAQQLPDWQDSLSQSQNVQNSTFIATPAGCSSRSNYSSPKNETIYYNALSTPKSNNNTSYNYSQNTEGDTKYYSALSGDSTASESIRTCYNSALDQTPSQAQFNVTGRNLTVNSNIDANVQLSDRMLGNIVRDATRSIESDDSYVLKPPRKLPNRQLQQTFSPNQSYQSYGPVNNNQTMSRSFPAAGTVDSPVSMPQPPYTIPQAAKRSRRVRPGQDTFPRSANRSALEAPSSTCSPKCPSQEYSGIPDFATDESYEQNFQPPLSSTQNALPSLEDSSELEYFGGPISRSQDGKYNIITPMTPSPQKQTNATFAAPIMNQPQENNCPCSERSAQLSSSRLQTSGRSSRPSPGQQTFRRSANRSMLNESGYAQSVNNQTMPRNQPAAANTSIHNRTAPRMPQETFLRSPNNTGDFNTTGNSCSSECPSQEYSEIRDFATDESYEQNFQPLLSSSYNSFPSLQDSSEEQQFFGGPISRSQDGKYNIITPMTPSPPKQMNRTFAPTMPQNNCACNPQETFQRSANRSMLINEPGTINNQTMARSFNNRSAPHNRTGPVGTPGGYRNPSQSPNTLPRAKGRSSRPRRGEDTFPRSFNRSVLDEGSNVDSHNSWNNSNMSSFGGQECACSGSEGSENIVSYSSQVVENFYEED